MPASLLDQFSDVLGSKRGTGQETTETLYRSSFRKDDCLVEEYRLWLGGPLHREDGPAEIAIFDDGSKHEAYFRNGVLHREDGPALIIEDDRVRSETWYHEGKKHRDDGGPADSIVAFDGSEVRIWYCHGKKHRLIRPAVIRRQPNGVEVEEYWENDWPKADARNKETKRY